MAGDDNSTAPGAHREHSTGPGGGEDRVVVAGQTPHLSDTGAGSAGGTVGGTGVGTVGDADVLARQLADLARDLQAGTSAQEVLDRAVASAVELVPGAEEGSISLVRARRQVTSAAWTGPAGRRLDDLQTELGQGPCLDAVFTHSTTVVEDLATDSRWPALAARAGHVGMASMLCLQLYVDGDNLGAMNLLGTRPGSFGDASEHVGLLLAAHAAVAVADARQQENTYRGLAHRDVIGQAKGVLMERHKLTPDQAFAVLSKLSQDLNRKLYDVAAELAATGELPSRTAGSTRPARG